MAYSRLQTHEKNQLIKQSVLFFAGGTGVLILFFFVLLPLLTKILMLNVQKIRTPTGTPTVSIASPVISAPYTATNSAQVTITGSATPDIFILLGVNGIIGPKLTASSSGSFKFENVPLAKGENTLIAYAEDKDGNRSDGSNALTISYTTDAPKLEVTEPTEGVVITQRKQSVIQVKGKVDPGNKVYLNGQFLFVSGDGSFTGSFQLQPGENTLTVKAVSQAGNEISIDIHVKYLP